MGVGVGVGGGGWGWGVGGGGHVVTIVTREWLSRVTIVTREWLSRQRHLCAIMQLARAGCCAEGNRGPVPPR
ncbi:hypothetical protein Jiend_36860 [Micromonospora endophytica]|nr:hypothetical protein Jiend_36860 [Micromonospora endophytica]